MNFRRLSCACLLVIMIICTVLFFKPFDVSATTYPISVTSSSNPNIPGIGDPVNATIYSSNNFLSQTGEGLFDGEIVNEWDTNQVYYWFGAHSTQQDGDQMLEIEFPEAVNIWRTGTRTWAGDYHYLQIVAWDGNGYTDDVTHLHTIQTSSLVHGVWEPFVVNLPAGKYKIGMDSTVGYKQRIDSEWYVESAATSEILACAQAATAAVETAENTLDIDDYNEARSKVDSLYTPVHPGVYTIPLSTATEETFTIDGTWHIINESVLLTVNQPDVKIVGESTEGVFIDNYDAYSYGVVVSADGAVISNLTIDCKDDPNITGDKDGYATFLQNDSNNVTLQNCVLVGPDIREAVKYNGKTISSLNDVENRSLDNGNKFLNCTVNSSFYGEGVSFSQQKNGVCKGNTINGTRRIAIESFV